MATFQIMEIQAEHVYIVITRDDLSTVGQMVKAHELDRSSVPAMMTGLRRRAWKLLQEELSPPPPPLGLSELATQTGAFPAQDDQPSPPLSDAEKEAAALNALNGSVVAIDTVKLIKAKAISDEAYRLGKAPGALTGPELQALRQRIANIYKAL